MSLSFEKLREVNERRCHRWHPAWPSDDDGWTIADWSNAACGEVGEMANVVKKLRRVETGNPGANDGDIFELLDALSDEMADVIIYIDLLAAKLGIDLAPAIVRKFNAVSEREGFPERLGEEPEDFVDYFVERLDEGY